MGIIGDISGGVGDIFDAFRDVKEGRDKKRQARDAQDQYYDDAAEQRAREGAINYTPAYVGDSAPVYKRSQSPVARAYLESMLTGQNPQAAVSPWDAAGSDKAATQSFNKTFGPYDQLVARGEKQRQETPWQSKTPKPLDQSALGGPYYPGNYDANSPGISGSDQQRAIVEAPGKAPLTAKQVAEIRGKYPHANTGGATQAQYAEWKRQGLI